MKKHEKINSQKTTTKLVAVNEHGRRIGETHPGAKVSDHEVELILKLRDAKWGYRRIAKAMEMSRETVRDIARGTTRCQTVERFKKL